MPPNRPSETADGYVLAQFIALACIWGTSFLFIKIGLEGLSPAQVVLARMMLGTLILAAVLLISRQRLPRDPAVWAHLALVGLLLCVIPFLLFAWAELRIPSGLASILNATTPLMTMLVATIALRSERLGRARAAGLLLGFAGVIIVFVPWSHTFNPDDSFLAGDLPAKVACLAATLCYGIAFIWLRRFIAPRGLPAVPTAFLQVGLGTLALLTLAPWIATTPIKHTPSTIWSVLALGILGTGLAYVWNTNVVNCWGAVRASTVTYLAPLVGVIAGATVLNETLTWTQIAGGLIIITGVLAGHDAWRPVLRAFTRKAAGATAPAAPDYQV